MSEFTESEARRIAADGTYPDSAKLGVLLAIIDGARAALAAACEALREADNWRLEYAMHQDMRCGSRPAPCYCGLRRYGEAIERALTQDAAQRAVAMVADLEADLAAATAALDDARQRLEAAETERDALRAEVGELRQQLAERVHPNIADVWRRREDEKRRRAHVVGCIWHEAAIDGLLGIILADDGDVLIRQTAIERSQRRRTEADLAAATTRIRVLEEALRPFARFAEQYNRQPMRGLDDLFYCIHTGTEYEAELRISDCRKALDALAQPGADAGGENG